MTSDEHYDGDVGGEQLARTPLGQAATKFARNVSSQDSGRDLPGSWLIQGVIWQQCEKCHTVCYPPRPLCSSCLSEQLQWKRSLGGGRLLSTTCLHASLNKYYQSSIRELEPWKIGLVLHDDGPLIFVFLDKSVTGIGCRIALFTAPDVIGESIILGVGEGVCATQTAESIAARLICKNKN